MSWKINFCRLGNLRDLPKSKKKKKKKEGPWGPELIWQMATKYKISRQNGPVIYICVFVYVKKYACVSVCMCAYVCLCVCVCICMCWCLCRCMCMCCVSVHVYSCGMPNIKFISLAYMHVTKVQNVKVVLHLCPCVSVCVHLSVCTCIVCVVCQM